MSTAKKLDGNSSAALILRRLSVPARMSASLSENTHREGHISLDLETFVNSNADHTNCAQLAETQGMSVEETKDIQTGLPYRRSSMLYTIKEKFEYAGSLFKTLSDRRSTAPALCATKKVMPRRSRTMHSFTCTEEETKNCAIDSLLQSDTAHQESLKQKQRLALLLQETKPVQLNSENNNTIKACPVIEQEKFKTKLRDNNIDEIKDTDEILTPFDAMRGISLCAPSYWLGCSYVFLPISKRIVIKIRPTGVMPYLSNEAQFRKLTLQVALMDKKDQKQNLTLLKSSKDTSFRSHRILFKHVDAKDVKRLSVRLRVFSSGVLRKKLIDEWIVPLKDCEAIFEHTNWRRCQF